MKMTWKDGLESRSRENRLLVLPPGEQPYWFRGGSDENVTVLASLYKKNGKWSHTVYELEIKEGVKALAVTEGWESGKWREGFTTALGLDPTATWTDIAATLQAPEESLIGPKPEKGPGKYFVIPNGPPPAKASEID